MNNIYVLGFTFLTDGRVVLIRKNKPAFQAGRLNGVGGRVEKTDASNKAAMAREFQEETGVFTHDDDWTEFAVMPFPDSTVFCYVSVGKIFANCQTTTDERVVVMPPGQVETFKPMLNVPFLVQMATTKLYAPDAPRYVIKEY